jgi:hypothetical protein
MPTWEISYIDRAMRRHTIEMLSDEKPTLGTAATVLQTRVTGRHFSGSDLLKFPIDPIVFLLARGIVITSVNRADDSVLKA